ncbi:MAG: DUF2652 domain-containing protein [Deltaproteobacteria bacterium]|nr:DUF2652 domain-containing protein [Deltaproteobacteria bacterium]
MTSKRKSLAHAQAIITELMESIITEIKIPLHIIEVEGDAVFFYGVEEPGAYTWEQLVSLTSNKLFDFFQAFYHRLDHLRKSNMCHCSACDGISNLKLKIIAHIGEALFYKIDKFAKLGGPDVILLHRLLKNSIEADEYLLMTDQSFSEISQYKTFEVEGRFEDYDELGRVGLYAHYPGITGPNPEESQADSNNVNLYQKMKQTMKIGLRGMFIMHGLKKQRTFRNLPG